MKRHIHILIGFGAVALLGYAGYTTARIHDLDTRLRAAEVRLHAADAALLRITTTSSRPARVILPPESPLEERVRRLEEERMPKMRLLSETGKR